MAHFQVLLGDTWQDYVSEEDKLLKEHFLMKHKGAKVTLSFRHQRYEFDFKHMTQRNLSTGKVRQIRPPRQLQSSKGGASLRPSISTAAAGYPARVRRSGSASPESADHPGYPARGRRCGSVSAETAEHPAIILPSSAVSCVPAPGGPAADTESESLAAPTKAPSPAAATKAPRPAAPTTAPKAPPSSKTVASSKPVPFSGAKSDPMDDFLADLF
mmetsp:Transcript_85951/g.152255  ORF Transcript_85951/g.152255 Transcript_85951/m.152255 type:complete len:215 (+) Transcript_85951:66-710(+)